MFFKILTESLVRYVPASTSYSAQPLPCASQDARCRNFGSSVPRENRSRGRILCHKGDAGASRGIVFHGKTISRGIVVYPDGAHVFLLSGSAVPAELPVQPLPDVPDALRRRYDVERRRRGPALLEITDPKFAPRELPLDVGAFLRIGNTESPPAN